jgi:hypothetical protein
MINVSVTGTERIKAVFAQLDNAVKNKIIRQTANDVKDYVEQQADTHTKTGALARSVYISRISDGYEIGHDERMAPYAKFVHWGTKPHVIKPKDKKALRFVAGGKFVFAKSVNHPGYVGHPWLKTAVEQVAPEKFKQNLSKIVSVL